MKRSAINKVWKSRRFAATAAAFTVLGAGAAVGVERNGRTDDPAHDTARHPCAEATEQCDGTLDVPLNWAEPEGRTIEAGFAWVPRAGRSSPATGTVLVHPGGFGAYTGGTEVFRELLGPALDHLNLLVVDMRGTGTSSPLRCPGLDVRDPATIASCAEQLGPDRDFYATDQAVADIDAIRDALGVERLSFYGSSYGTVYAQAYATRFPDRTAAVLLDSPDLMRPEGYGRALAVDSFGRGLADLDMVCERSVAYRELPGSADDRLASLVELLRERPDERVPLEALAQVVQKKGGDAVIGREINAAVAAYLDGDPAPLHRLALPVLDIVQQPGVPINEDDTAALPYSCGDFTYPFDREAPAAERQRQLDENYANERPVAPFTVEEVFGFTGGSYPQWCVPWPAGRESPPIPPGAAYPDVPALVIGGELDGGMGADEAELVADRFPNGQALTVPFGGHVDALDGADPHGACLREVVRSFLATPEQPVGEPGCDAENYRALGTFPRVLAQVPPPVGPSDGLDPADGRLLAAAFGTVDDALSRTLPEAGLVGQEAEQPGLRDGRITLDRESGTVVLDGASWVEDVAVTGEAHVSEGDTAGADVRVEADGDVADVRFDWTTRTAEDAVRVTGTLDGTPFAVTVPAP
ncbi:alpha/beta fold hydrolase [Streptomyces sedi]|uniref:alpha/beta fold hydrolase n=1 Tax=Streptomyces sedi TaxID=555059 RepID=UPI0014774E57|nr:alpha/beta fold hydrolase [Streptomyces sedi]